MTSFEYKDHTYPHSGKSVQWEVQHKQRFVQVGVEIGTKGKKRNDQES